MKKISIIHYSLFIILCVFALSSCRPESDPQWSYGQYDNQVYGLAGANFEQQFIGLWTALNENYCIWDFELEQGLDWDEVYYKYLPQFQALDQKQEVTDEELMKLYGEVLFPLHDGHANFQVRNLSNGHFLGFNPSLERNKSRPDCQFSMGFTPDIKAYTDIPGDCHIAQFQSASSTQIQFISNSLDKASKVVDAKLEELEQKETLTEEEQLIVQYGKMFLKDASSLEGMSLSEGYSMYNKICVRYAMLADLLGFELTPVDETLANYTLDVASAYLDAGIAYFRFSGFNLSPFLDPGWNVLNLANPSTKAIQQSIYDVWKAWFDKIQELKKSNALKGVIIDVRSNTGGYNNDFQFALGALLPSGGFSGHMERTKAGTGRYDFAPMTPFTFNTYKEEHVVISEEPIVVLANGFSVSMAEMTSLSTKSIANARLVGMRTWGGLCSLVTDPAFYSDAYSGSFGVKNQTPFYAYLPQFVSILPELGILEGTGVTPDIEVAFDQSLYESTGRDNQFERAVQYILTGN
ncbi:MAG: hypothetical protein J5884_00670 [Paludibacteraceae bacterium]|nr:hypothetical protein [Paludibacteraceae bacterium]